MSRIRQSSAYDQFELSPFNRDLSKTVNLGTSMRRHGWIDAYPMHVVKNGHEKFIIKAGHHRFTVARQLGIPVKFVVCTDEATIPELERTKNTWELTHYGQGYLRMGLPDYDKVWTAHKETGISLSLCISMLGGDSAGSGNCNKAFKSGNFRMGDPTHFNTVAEIHKLCRQQNIEFYNHNLFVQAISKIVRVKELNIDQLKYKIVKHKQIIIKQPTKQGYVELLEKIYNYGSSTKLPLAFMANEVARERQGKFFKPSK